MNETHGGRKLKAFTVLIKTRSYTELAKRLYKTHSAICHSTRALNEQFSCRLFAKVSKKYPVRMSFIGGKQPS